MARHLLPTLAILILAGGLSASADEVILDYQAKASTVTGTPFGISVPRLAVVTGSFVYDTDGAVDSNASTERGKYDFAGAAAFSANFLEHTIAGSGSPQLQVENIQVSDGSIDTFRYIDGDSNERGTMTFDGTPDLDVELFFAMTDGSGAAFADDSLPAVFPMTIPPGGPSIPHTFRLSDDQGTMLLQFDWLVQRAPRKPVITDVSLAGDSPSIEFESQPGHAYDIEFSLDLASWQIIAADYPSAGTTTEFTDNGIVARLGELPDAAFYRVRESD